MVEKPKNIVPLKKAISEKIDEKPKVQTATVEVKKANVEDKKMETSVENLDWKSSLKSFELQEEATLESYFF